nr:MAG TPA: hypothetical protein [Caudoviricetes sp.]
MRRKWRQKHPNPLTSANYGAPRALPRMTPQS